MLGVLAVVLDIMVVVVVVVSCWVNLETRWSIRINGGREQCMKGDQKEDM